VTVAYTTTGGRQVTEDYEGYTARVVQHEVDHLDGIEFLDRADQEQRIARERDHRPVRMT
jgi:peptide deformylase